MAAPTGAKLGTSVLCTRLNFGVVLLAAAAGGLVLLARHRRDSLTVTLWRSCASNRRDDVKTQTRIFASPLCLAPLRGARHLLRPGR